MLRNLDGSTLQYLKDKYGGTTLGRQELDAELIEDVEGALWNRALIEAGRRTAAPENMRQIVVAIDPAGGTGKGSTETGIIIAGVDRQREFYVLADRSGQFTPEQWARKAIGAYGQFKANRVIAERNYGGAMVEATLRNVDRDVPVRMVQASRGKAVRAEPVVALYEQRRVHHVGTFPDLEDQLCQWDPNGNDPSPDRLDALVWAISDLMNNSFSATVTPLRM